MACDATGTSGAELGPRAFAVLGREHLIAEETEDRCESKHIPQQDPNQIFSKQRRGRERR
jgi:hypothetical protein